MKQRGFIFPALGPMFYVAIAVAIAAGIFMLRMHWIQVGREEILQQNIRAAVKIVREQGAVTERVVVKYVKMAGATRTKIEVREKEVIRYEKANLDQCPLSNAFVSLHDAAATNAVPNPASITDGTPSGVKAAETIPTVQANYSTCHQTADRLRGLQEWVMEQQKVTQ